MLKKTEAEIALAKEQRRIKLRFKAALVNAQLNGLSTAAFAEALFRELEALRQRNSALSGNANNHKESK